MGDRAAAGCWSAPACLPCSSDAFVPRVGRALAVCGGPRRASVVAAGFAVILIDDEPGGVLPAGSGSSNRVGLLVGRRRRDRHLVAGDLGGNGAGAVADVAGVGVGDLPTGEFCFLLLTSATGALGVAASLDLITLRGLDGDGVAAGVRAGGAAPRPARRRGGAEVLHRLRGGDRLHAAGHLDGLRRHGLGCGRVGGGLGADAARPSNRCSASAMMLTVVGLAFKVAVGAVPGVGARHVRRGAGAGRGLPLGGQQGRGPGGSGDGADPDVPDVRRHLVRRRRRRGRADHDGRQPRRAASAARGTAAGLVVGCAGGLSAGAAGSWRHRRRTSARSRRMR